MGKIKRALHKRKFARILSFIRNNIVYIIILTILLFVFFPVIPMYGLFMLILNMREWSETMLFIHDLYTLTIVNVLVFVLWCLIFRRNRFILRSVLPKGMGKKHKIRVVEDTYHPTQNNTFKMFLVGILIGFGANFLSIVCAMIHGDINFFYGLSVSQIPILLYALLVVFIQSSSEELMTRGFMYERLNIHYPLWVAILANGVLFGLLHMFNAGVSVLGIIDVCISGFSMSLMRWYSGSIWMAFGYHTMWNFTQNFIFGLPNSGYSSGLSIFHMYSTKGLSNIVYDFDFGVEGGLPSVIFQLLICIIILVMAKKSGRLKELLMSYEKIGFIGDRTIMRNDMMES